MSTHHQICICSPLTPENLKRAKADIKQYSIAHEPARWADCHMLLAQQCNDQVMGSAGPTRAADKAIEHIEEALKVITEENDARSFLLAQYLLARMYTKRVSGNRTENLTKALACVETALRVFENVPCPLPVAATLHEIFGSIYADHDFESSNSRAANDDLAIRHYLASLERSSMYSSEDYDVWEWAKRQQKVGLIYCRRKNGKPRSNSKVAIKHFVEALKVFTKSTHRDDWAKTHEYLALSYTPLIDLASLTQASDERFAELVEKHIASCTNALQVCTPTYDAMAW
jgi:tetratricopeptide (TPR) repeat protein